MPVKRPQIENGVAEVEAALVDIQNAVNRVRYLSGKVIADIKRLEDAAGEFDTFTEAEAAEKLKIHETLLAKERKRHGLPHIAFSNKIRYTADHLRRICEILEANKTKGAKPSALRRAA